jgi:Na+/proline symporter
MNPIVIALVLGLYFILLFVISAYTSRKATNASFYQANKSAHWLLVAFGMVGTSLSGVTFISVPGTVSTAHFYYFQVVIGYFIGYFVVAFVLLPLYYRLQLVSIYTYLLNRFGMNTYRSGATLFVISRTLGATLRLYLVINVLQLFVLDALGIPFVITAFTILMMILAYTFKGGVKTIVWTDTLQTFFMLLALVVCVVFILNHLDISFSQAIDRMTASGHLQVFNFDINDKRFFVKQILGGAFITISMTGLDQEMMQKNISVKTLKDSQKNMLSFSAVMTLVNFLFLFLGGLLCIYAAENALMWQGDDLFPTIVMQHLPPAIGLIFIIGLISALFPSADGAITALTASFCIDILRLEQDPAKSTAERMKTRKKVHLTFALIFLLMVIFFKWLDNKEIVTILLEIAGYTYGPLLGMFAFGIMTQRVVTDKWVPWVCIAAPALVMIIDKKSADLLGGYRFGFEILLINGLLTFAGIWSISTTQKKKIPLTD